jgi:hypothetical protein
MCVLPSSQNIYRRWRAWYNFNSICRKWCNICVGVWSYEGPKPTSKSMLCVPNLDGDARRVHEGLSWFGRKNALRPAGRGVLYFLTPKCLRRGYKL